MERTEQITKLVAEGKSQRQIAKILEVAPGTIRYWLKKLKITTPQGEDENGNKGPKHALLGEVFGHLTVIEMVQMGTSRSWGCICSCICGKITKPILSVSLLRGATRSCGCKLGFWEKVTGENSSTWKGYGEISGQRWGRIIRRAEVKGRTIDIAIETAWDLFLRQDKKCALSGIDLCFGRNNRETTASLDRIDSSKGYVIGNVQWVHKTVNIMKNAFDQKVFIEFCKKIVDHHKEQEKETE